jgi:hypothetical protein
LPLTAWSKVANSPALRPLCTKPKNTPGEGGENLLDLGPKKRLKSHRVLENNGEKMSRMQEKFIIDGNGNKTAVVLPLKYYQRLLEDIHDLTVVAERRDEPTITFEEVKRRLRRDGFIQD